MLFSDFHTLKLNMKKLIFTLYDVISHVKLNSTLDLNLRTKKFTLNNKIAITYLLCQIFKQPT